MAYNKLDGDSDAAEAHSKAAGKKKDMAKKMKGKGGFDYDGMMRDVHKSFPGIKLNGKSPYKPEHKK